MSSLLCLIPLVLAAIYYDKLPDELPVHWNIEGEVDRYASKFFAIIGMPLIMFGVDLLVKSLTLLDPKQSLKNNKKMRVVIMLIIPALSTLVVIITILTGLGNNINIVPIILFLIGLIFTFIGNYLPKTSQNYTVGIKIPWTLNDEYNWNKTHRLAGLMFVLSGLSLIIVSVLSISNTIRFAVLIGTIVLDVIVPILYSLVLYINRRNKEEDS